MDTKEYASVVGAAIFISTACRPDIAQAISRVSRAMHGPTELDAKHVITLLQYLNHTRKVKLVFRRDHHPISEEEGVNQFKPRNYRPPIFDASGRAPDVALTSAHGPGGVSVYDCGSSKVISHAVEKALHEHFAPICDASDDKMPRLWRKRGAGYAQGIGPYHVCIRIMPLPMPHGWRRSF